MEERPRKLAESPSLGDFKGQISKAMVDPVLYGQ